jgi:hypothetical protein
VLYCPNASGTRRLFGSFLIPFAGHLNQQRQDVIDYLQEEIRKPRVRLGGKRRLRLTTT